jgi:hypothetical protein
LEQQIITDVRPVLNIPIMQLEQPLLQGKYFYLLKMFKQNMFSHELYEVIETELVQDNLDPNAPEVMDVCAVSSHLINFIRS